MRLKTKRVWYRGTRALSELHHLQTFLNIPTWLRSAGVAVQGRRSHSHAGSLHGILDAPKTMEATCQRHPRGGVPPVLSGVHSKSNCNHVASVALRLFASAA